MVTILSYLLFMKQGGKKHGVFEESWCGWSLVSKGGRVMEMRLERCLGPCNHWRVGWEEGRDQLAVDV